MHGQHELFRRHAMHEYLMHLAKHELPRYLHGQHEMFTGRTMHGYLIAPCNFLICMDSMNCLEGMRCMNACNA